MSLEIALQNALSGLIATQNQLQVISGNITNAQTPGYSEEVLPQFPQANSTGGAGTVTGTVQRVTSYALQQSLTEETTVAGASTTLNSYYQQVQSLFGQVGSGNTLGDSYNQFQTAMQALATTPEDPVAQTNAVNAGQVLADKLNSLSSGVQNLRQSTDTAIATSVSTLNTALNTIAQLNGSIAQLGALGQPTATLEDQRDQALNQVAQLIGVKSYVSSNGNMVVMTNSGRNLVTGTTAQQFGYTASGTVSATTTLSPLTLAGADVTGETTSGQIGALLQMRDTTLPGMTSQLNQFTNNLFALTTAPTLNTTNSGLGVTNDANHMFAAVDIAGGLDNAATVVVNPDLTGDPSLLYNGTGGPDPTIATTLAASSSTPTTFAAAGGLQSLTTTLGNYLAQVTGNNANAAAAANSDSSNQTALLNQMQSQYSTATGVNLDAELTSLVTYQNAYGASARVITTLQSMYASLMNI
jgi:flagellar hook-associated protein 1